MAKGALYYRLKDEKTGKWTYQRIDTKETNLATIIAREGWTLVGEE